MLWRDCFPVRQARVRPLAAFALMALAGTIAAWLCRPSPALCLGLCGCAGGALLACGLMKRPMLAAALALGLCLGMARMTLALARFPVATTVYSVPMTGKVISEPWLRPDTGRLIFKFRLNTVDGAPDDRVVRLYLRGDAAAMADIRYGQTLSVTGNIWASDPVTNPYQFDFGAWLHRNGLNCIATAKIERAGAGRLRGLERHELRAAVVVQHAETAEAAREVVFVVLVELLLAERDEGAVGVESVDDARHLDDVRIEEREHLGGFLAEGVEVVGVLIHRHDAYHAAVRLAAEPESRRAADLLHGCVGGDVAQEDRHGLLRRGV